MKSRLANSIRCSFLYMNLWTGWLEKIERQPMDPSILRGAGPATVER